MVNARRVTYVGELGWELYIPSEATSCVLEVLQTACEETLGASRAGPSRCVDHGVSCCSRVLSFMCGILGIVVQKGSGVWAATMPSMHCGWKRATGRGVTNLDLMFLRLKPALHSQSMVTKSSLAATL